MIAAIHELRRHKPAALYLPNIDEWFDTLSESVRMTLLQLIENSIPSHVLFLASTFKPFCELSDDIKELFSTKNTGHWYLSGKCVIKCERPDKVNPKFLSYLLMFKKRTKLDHSLSQYLQRYFNQPSSRKKLKVKL